MKNFIYHSKCFKIYYNRYNDYSIIQKGCMLSSACSEQYISTKYFNGGLSCCNKDYCNAALVFRVDVFLFVISLILACAMQQADFI